MPRILIVDDEDGIRSVLADALAGAGHSTAQAGDVRAAFERLEDEPFDVMLSDLRMPGDLDGMDLVRRARAQWPDMQIIVLTAHGSIDVAVEAMKLGAFHFMEKPISSPADLRALVQRALNWRGRRQDGSTVGQTAAQRPHDNANTDVPPRSTAVDEPGGRLRNLLWQLKRRRVYSVAVGYAAIGFLGLQAAELILPAVRHPDWLYPALVGLTLAGFPVAVLLGWVFDITARGIRRTDA